MGRLRADELETILNAYAKSAKRLDELLDKRLELYNRAIYKSRPFDHIPTKGGRNIPDKFVEGIANVDQIEEEILKLLSEMPAQYNAVENLVHLLGHDYDARLAIEWRYINGAKWHDIAKKLDVNISYIYRIRKRALETLTEAEVDVLTLDKHGSVPDPAYFSIAHVNV